MIYIYTDIETLPSQSAEYRAKVKDNIKAPGNIKKMESIAAWLADNGETATNEAIAKTSFDPAAGHICTIGWAVGDGEIVSAHADNIEGESDVIRAFFDGIHYSKTRDAACFVGHYISGFDLRFIMCRAIVLGIPIPPSIPRDIKPWSKEIFDTMTAWSGAKGSISLDNLCYALGIPGEDGLDGSMVSAAWANGEHEKIARYCEDDVRKVRMVHKKFQAVGF